MTDYNLALMAGADIPIPELQATVHVPIIEDIAYMGEKNYFTAVQYLCIDKESLTQDKIVLQSMTNFQVLMRVLSQSQDKEKKQAISTLLTIMFPEYNNVITPRSIVLTAREDKTHIIMIDDNNFEMVKEIFKQVLCVSSIFQGENIIYNPGNARAKAIADKLMRGRRKAAEINAKKAGNNSVFVRYISILSVAQVATIEECKKYNIFQLFDLIERYMAYVEWDSDLRVRLAGGKPDKQVESWMRDLHGPVSTAFTAADVGSGIQVY